MSDQYLVRGKRVENGEWIEGYYYKYPHSDGVYICESLFSCYDPLTGYFISGMHKVDPATVE